MAGIGHNSGRVVEPGKSWRKHVWTKARRDLMPTLPLEVVRMRVRRAAELGLPYKTYAGIRASSGHDLIGFLFSSNALRVMTDAQQIPKERAMKLCSLRNTKCPALAHRPVTPEHLATQPGIDQAYAAPQFAQSWRLTRDQLWSAFIAMGKPADRFVMIGDMTLERDWAEAAQLAGYLSAADFFGEDGSIPVLHTN